MDSKENAIAIRYNDDYSVVQANELIRSRQDSLTLLEAKLIRLAITQVVKEDTDLKTYSCKVSELAKFLDISPSNVYRDIQDLTRNLMKKSIFMKDTSQPSSRGKENYKIFHWIDYIEYTDGTLTFKLSEGLKPYLVGLDKFFTSYSYYYIKEASSTNAVRLYELLASYQKMCREPVSNPNYTNVPIGPNELIFTLDWLREVLDCEDKYPNNKDFIRKVIDRSIESIKEHTTMQPTYRLVKEGRRFKYIIFKLDQEEEEMSETRKKMREITKRYEERKKRAEERKEYEEDDFYFM